MTGEGGTTVSAEVSESEIAGELLAGFVDAWNRRDMGALGDAFGEDAGFVDVRGTFFRGRDVIQRQHADEIDGPYQDSALRNEVVDARQPVPGVIVGHAKMELNIAGSSRRALLTFVIERRADVWRITEAHNSIVLPPTSQAKPGNADQH